MVLSRVFLALTGLVLMSYGVYCLFYPLALQEFTAIELTSPTAVTEVRAMYGGLEIAIGLYFFVCAMRPSMVAQALVLMIFCFAGLAGARAFGISVDDDSSAYNLGAIIYEGCSGLIALLLLQLQPGKSVEGDIIK